MKLRNRSRIHKPESSEPLQYKDYHQVQLDIARVTLTKAASVKLEKRVGTVLAENPQLNYYQGFHEIAIHCHSTKQLENLSLQQLRDFMTPTIDSTIDILKLVPELLARADSEGIGRYFVNDISKSDQSRKMMGYFAVAPIVTLFSHDCDDSRVIGSIIRTVLREGLSYVIYLYVSLVIENKELLGSVSGEEDELDMKLQKLASTINYSNFSEINRRAKQLRARYPLEFLPSWPKISHFSVLKTGKITNRSTALYSLERLDMQNRDTGGFLHSKLLGGARFSVTAVFAVVLGATMFGLLWGRNRR